MDEKEIEKADSEIAEEEKEVAADVAPEEEEEPKFTDAERKAFARAKVAEAKVKDLKAQLEKAGASKSDALDYGQKAYLASNGIKGAKEFEFVQAQLKESGKDLDSLLENKYFNAALEEFRALDKTAEATPTGKRSSGVATDSVEYWMAKPFEEVPKDMRAKVVQAKIDKEKNKGQFYNS